VIGVSVVGGAVTGIVVGAAVVVVGRGRVVVVVEDLAAVEVVVTVGSFAGLTVEDPQPASMSNTATAAGRHALTTRIAASHYREGVRQS
jgi:hypothetical protein